MYKTDSIRSKTDHNNNYDQTNMTKIATDKNIRKVRYRERNAKTNRMFYTLIAVDMCA